MAATYPSQEPTLKAWRSMMSRCNNPNDKDYKGIGGRGVMVCALWQDYERFLEDMGKKPEHCYMKRLDESADFEPGNVVWAEKVNAATNEMYTIWKGILRRCRRPGMYKDRGVQLYPDWEQDFRAFEAHMGPRPSPEHSVDRIDNNGGYFPGNVRWALRKEQSNNCSSNVAIEMDGERRTLSQWIDFYGADPGAVRSRWTKLFTPARKKNAIVQQLTPGGTLITEFPDVKTAAAATGLSVPNIAKCLSAGNKTAGGYLWAWRR